MTTLNGLSREWDSLIRGICVRIKLTKFKNYGINVYKNKEGVKNPNFHINLKF